jgi:hypothetical protein
MSTVSRATIGANHAAAVRDAAAQYIAAGVRVLPIEPNTKKPLATGWQKQATLDSSKLPALWPDQQDYSIGLAMGRWAGTTEFETWLVCIDLDCKPGQPNGVKAWEALVAEHGGDEGKPWVQFTPSGGVHMVYAIEHPHSNAKGQLPAGIDVRGEGGQIVAWPSNGAQRRWKQGRAPWDHQPGFAPEWLLDLLQPATPPLPPVERSRLAAVDDPGEIYNATTDWGTLLAGYGWRYLSTSNQGGRLVEHWERPGQTEHGKAGATLCKQSGKWGVFYVWSSNAPAQLLAAKFADPQGRYQAAFSGPFAFFAAMEHGGDFSAAARQLGRDQRQQDSDALSNMTGTRDGDTAHQDTASEPKKTRQQPEPGHSVRFATLAEYQGDLQQRKADLLTDETGQGLLYSNSENMIWGASGGGKSWLGGFTSLQEIRKGNRVLIIDYEMSMRDWALRLKQLGATQAELALVEYISPQEALREARYVNGSLAECPTVAAEILGEQLELVAKRGQVSFALIDGVTEMMSGNLLKINDGEDIAKMWQALPQLITDITGAAGLAIDHISHAGRKEARQWEAMPIGSQHKLSGITGAGHCVWASSPLSAIDKGNSVGLLHIYCHKDRHGDIGRLRHISTLQLTPLPGGQVQARLLPYDPEQANAANSVQEQQNAVLLALVAELHQARSEKRVSSSTLISGRWLAKEMTSKGYKMSKDTCTDLLVKLAAAGLVRNAGVGNRADWVPVISDLFSE